MFISSDSYEKANVVSATIGLQHTNFQDSQISMEGFQ